MAIGCRTFWMVLCVVAASRGVCASEVRIKDITTIEGQRFNVLTGVGLVAGLAGTGSKTPATRQFAVNILQRAGQRVDSLLRANIRNDTQQKTDNLSVVIVSAEMPTDARKGQGIDATVSTLDDAESLRGGYLVMTPLRGVDGNVHATVAGPVSLGGGFSFSGDAATAQRNHPTVGRLVGKAIVEVPIPIIHSDLSCLRLLLIRPDWNTANRITEAINYRYASVATTESYGIVYVTTPIDLDERARFIADISSLLVQPDIPARVVINERTGTVVIGGNVQLSQVAISHGSLSVVTGETPEVSQPLPFSDGETTVVPRTELDVIEEANPITIINEAATVNDLSAALNALGVTPSDLSAIFQQLHASGALHAHLEFQ